MNCANLVCGGRAVLRRIYCSPVSTTSTRNTWIFKHEQHFPITNRGQDQISSEYRQDFQVLKPYRRMDRERRRPFNVILTKKVEGKGDWGDTVELDPWVARRLLLMGDAVYDNEFNQTIFQEDRRVQFIFVSLGLETIESVRLGRKVKLEKNMVARVNALKKQIIPLKLSATNPWTLTKSLLRLSLRQAGIFVEESAIIINPVPYSGPQIQEDGALIRFYIIYSESVSVPMIGRLEQLKNDGKGATVLMGVQSNITSATEAAQWGVDLTEDVYFASEPFKLNMTNDQLWELMKKIMEDQKSKLKF